jgi:glycerophosphoryl diester phosphodiesterase
VQYWTINDPKEMRHLIERKADGIMTDYVDRVKQVMPSVRP